MIFEIWESGKLAVNEMALYESQSKVVWSSAVSWHVYDRSD